jgi:hypothetical protein
MEGKRWRGRDGGEEMEEVINSLTDAVRVIMKEEGFRGLYPTLSSK